MREPSLFHLEHLARGAGEILRSSYGSDIEISYKGVIDLVTDIDHRSESYLIDEIKQRFPGHRIVSEESGDHGGEDEHIWFVDPLDGTVNYAHRVPVFAVTIAYQHQGILKLGVVYDPMRDEMFSAQSGAGAQLNGGRIRVSSITQLDHSLLATGFAYDIRTHPETNLDHFSDFSLRSQGIRRLGSAAIDLSYVAAGRYDAFWELRLNKWDVAAGALIAAEAGAKVTNIYGEPDYLTQPQTILAANPTLHTQMLEVFQEQPHADRD